MTILNKKFDPNNTEHVKDFEYYLLSEKLTLNGLEHTEQSDMELDILIKLASSWIKHKVTERKHG